MAPYPAAGSVSEISARRVQEGGAVRKGLSPVPRGGCGCGPGVAGRAGSTLPGRVRRTLRAWDTCWLVCPRPPAAPGVGAIFIVTPK